METCAELADRAGGIKKTVKKNKKQKTKPKDVKGWAIYHRVYAHEDFEHAARTLYDLVYNTQRRCPGAKRSLFLDIDGHRNEAGGFDGEMFSLINQFIMPTLMKYLTSASVPIFGEFARKDGSPQIDEIPQVLVIEYRPGKIPADKRNGNVADLTAEELEGIQAQVPADLPEDRAAVIFRKIDTPLDESGN
jgi:hypothetical protein